MDWCNGAAEGALGGLEAQANCCSLALRDYYPFWRHKLEAPDAGKILPVDISPDSKVRWLPAVVLVNATYCLPRHAALFWQFDELHESPTR